MRITLTLLLAFLFVTPSFSQKSSTGQEEFIMCIVHGEYNFQEGTKIAGEFKTAFNAKIVRLDSNSGKFYVSFETGKVSKDDVIAFFQKKSMKATCLFKGVQGVDTAPADISRENCK